MSAPTPWPRRPTKATSVPPTRKRSGVQRNRTSALSFSHSKAMRNAALHAQGLKKSSWQQQSPAKLKHVLAHPIHVLKACYGTSTKHQHRHKQRQNQQSEIKTPPPRTPKVSAAPIAPMQDNTGVPNNRESANMRQCIRWQIELQTQNRGANATKGKPERPANAPSYFP
jgi:hypothetical protein